MKCIYLFNLINSRRNGPSPPAVQHVSETSEIFSYRDVIWQPLRDAQLADLHRDLLSVAWFSHADCRQILKETHTEMSFIFTTFWFHTNTSTMRRQKLRYTASYNTYITATCFKNAFFSFFLILNPSDFRHITVIATQGWFENDVKAEDVNWPRGSFCW